MPHQHPQLAYDRITERESLRQTMDQPTIEQTLRFLISKLSESDLREYDALMEGSSLDTPPPERKSTPAMDAAFGSRERQQFLRLGPSARNAIRRGQSASLRQAAGLATDSAEAKEYQKRFPNADRLVGTGY